MDTATLERIEYLADMAVPMDRIAQQLGVSCTTVEWVLNGDETEEE